MDGRTVLITGASRGIGRAAAEAFAKEGANVVLVARSADEIGAIANGIGRDRARAVPCDVADHSQMQAAVETAVQAFGGLGILVLNAGIIDPIAPFAEVDPAGFGQLIDVNLKGVFHGMQAALPVMAEAGGGTVLTISSGAASRPLEGWAAYCASKAGAAMLVRQLDLEARGAGIRSIGLSPGTVATDMQKEIKASGIGKVAALDWDDHIPPDWPARALVWLAGPAGDAWLGQEVSLRDEGVRRSVGLID